MQKITETFIFQFMNSEEKAYSEGHQAYHDGYRLKSNPYKRFTLEWEEWRSGWNDEKNDDPYWEKVRRLQQKAYKKLMNG